MKRRVALLLLIIALLLPASGVRAATQDSPSAVVDAPVPSEPPTDTFQVVNHWPHDPSAYTEGLLYADGAFFESTGLNGMSSLRKVDAETGQVIASLPLDAAYFGEGLTLFNGKLIQLTWQSHIGFVYDLSCFCLERTFTYDGEGWGLTHDDHSLIMSDGTAGIRFLDPETFAIVRTISVTDHDEPLTNINELEYINGEIYANIWLTNRIVRIDPASGAILGWIDLTGLLPDADRSPSVNELNGIAYDDATDRLFVTGKNWPEIFQITLVPRSSDCYATNVPRENVSSMHAQYVRCAAHRSLVLSPRMYDNVIQRKGQAWRMSFGWPGMTGMKHISLGTASHLRKSRKSLRIAHLQREDVKIAIA